MHELGFGAVASWLADADIVGLLAANKKPGRKSSAGSTRPRPFSDLFNVAASRPAQMTTG